MSERSWNDIKGICDSSISRALELFPELEILAETCQDPRHHAEGDVLTHTAMCLAALTADCGYSALPAEWRNIVWLATLLHDLGKGSCTSEEAGVITSPHHSRRGATLARRLLWEAGCPAVTRERICGLIALHQVLFHTLDAGGPDIDWVLRRASLKAPLKALFILGRADSRGRLPLDNQSLGGLDLLEERAGELGCLESPALGLDGPTRLLYLDGRGKRPFELPAYDATGSKVLFTSGLPGSGKDYWLQRNRPELPRVSFDDIRKGLGIRHGKNDGLVTQLVMEQARVHLRAGEPFVWSATFLSKEMREKALRLVNDYRGVAEAVCIEASIEEILQRNRTREQQVPFAAIEKMLNKWEPPGLDEFAGVSFVCGDGLLPLEQLSAIA